VTTSYDEDELTFANAADNPGLLEAAAAVAAKEEAPEIPNPLDGPVRLTAGFRRTKPDGSFETVQEAWVKELNGEDEERIAKAKMRDNIAAFVYAILEAGVERLGTDVPTKDDLESLVMGDRDFLLLEIARATYGDTLEYPGVVCNTCRESIDVTLSLADDVPVKRLNSIDETDFEVRLRNDRVARVHLAQVEVAKDLAASTTPAEANTILLTNCVEEVRGPKGTVRIEGDPEAARRLGAKDRQDIIQAMSDKMPGPEYDRIVFKHEPGCGEEIRLGVTLADLFPGM
jgi:hypothetical protein